MMLNFLPDAGRTIIRLARVVEAAINAGATTINIPDTVGYTMPFEFAGIISACMNAYLTSTKPLFPYIPTTIWTAVGTTGGGGMVHAVEGAMNGIGERAGNCSLEEVIMAIKVRKDILNVPHRH